jgi:hypothetical protein
MTETDKKRAIKILTYGHDKAFELCSEAEDARRFFTPVTIATINGWSQQSGVSIRVHFKMDDEGFHIARDAAEDHTLIRWATNFWNVIHHPERLKKSDAA